MRVLITGGLGYLGGRLIASLTAQGRPALRVLAHGDGPLPEGFPAGVDVRRGAVEDEAAVRGVCDGVSHVVHLAGPDQRACQDSLVSALTVSGIGTLRVAEEAASAGVERFVYVSTSQVYGSTPADRLHEGARLRPVSPYGVSRVTGEACALMVAAQRDMRVVVLRLANGFGSPAFAGTQAWKLVVNDFCLQAVQKREIVLRRSGKQYRDFIPLTDVVTALDFFLHLPSEHLRYDVFNIGSGSLCTLFEFAERVSARYQQATGRSVAIRTGVDVEPDMPVRELDITRASSVGFVPKIDLDAEIDCALMAAAQVPPALSGVSPADTGAVTDHPASSGH